MIIKRLKSNELIPASNKKFVEVGLLPLFGEIAWKDPLILKGPKGAGKTINIEEWCAREGIPLIRENCNVGTDETNLLGSFGMEGDNVYFTLGALPTAVEVANEEGAAVLVLEEINTLRPQVQPMVFSLTDHRQSIDAASLGRRFSLLPDRNLWVVGTMNPGYSGTYQLNEALRSRFNFVEVGYMPRAEELKILENAFDGAVAAKERQLAARLLTFAEESRTGGWDYALSTRDLVYTVAKFTQIGVFRALAMLVNKFDPEHKPAILGRIQSIFAADLNGVKIYG
jgi:hypothetical protein